MSLFMSEGTCEASRLVDVTCKTVSPLKSLNSDYLPVYFEVCHHLARIYVEVKFPGWYDIQFQVEINGKAVLLILHLLLTRGPVIVS
jgi:hypothetical protein